MDRRDFLRTAGASAGALSLLPLAAHADQDGTGEPPEGAEGAEAAIETESGGAYAELLSALAEVEAVYLSPAYGITRPGDLADGHRFLMHVLQGGLVLHFEQDPERPEFRRIVGPHQKFLGDQPDALYYEAPIRPDRRYRIRGNTAGAVYTSFTIEGGDNEGGYSAGVTATLNDAEFDVAPDGSYEIVLAADAPAANGWTMPASARSITTRSYFEETRSVAADPLFHVPITIEPLDDPGPPPTWDDASIAAGIRRATNFVKGLTVAQPRPDERPEISWVSTVPNVFPKPAKPGNMAFAAVDNAYASAPYLLLPDQALVIEGRFPACRFSSVVLWNRFLQSYGYAHRRISLNRAQTKLEPDGSFRMVLAHRDPGVPNWLDTEGRPSGMVYWRFLLPEGDIETPRGTVVPFDEVRAG